MNEKIPIVVPLQLLMGQLSNHAQLASTLRQNVMSTKTMAQQYRDHQSSID